MVLAAWSCAVLSTSLMILFFLLTGRAYIGSRLAGRKVGVLGGRKAGDPARRRLGALGGFRVDGGLSRRSVDEEVEAPLS